MRAMTLEQAIEDLGQVIVGSNLERPGNNVPVGVQDWSPNCNVE